MQSSRRRIALLGLIFLISSAHCIAGKVEFRAVSTKSTEEIRGQIDWPSGRLRDYRGPVIVFISASNPSDRDGWLIRSIDAEWTNSDPLKALSVQLVKIGYAVVRFDNPGVKDRKLGCRAKAEAGKLTNKLVVEKCVDVLALSRLSVSRYIDSLENVLNHTQKLVPSAREQLTLVGISEGYWHVDEIIKRNKFKISTAVAIGASVESPSTLSKWQAIERPMQVIWKFDANRDGTIENEEITKGYLNGIGKITANVADWLSPYGYWNEGNLPSFEQRLQFSYSSVLSSVERHTGDKLNWIMTGGRVAVPDVNESFWRLHLTSKKVPLQTLKDSNVPALFLWGADDQQVRVSYQASLIEQAKAQGGDIEYSVFPDHYHLLSKKRDTDWFDCRMAEIISNKIGSFIDHRSDTAAASHSRMNTHPRSVR